MNWYLAPEYYVIGADGWEEEGDGELYILKTEAPYDLVARWIKGARCLMDGRSLDDDDRDDILLWGKGEIGFYNSRRLQVVHLSETQILDNMIIRGVLERPSADPGERPESKRGHMALYRHWPPERENDFVWIEKDTENCLWAEGSIAYPHPLVEWAVCPIEVVPPPVCIAPSSSRRLILTAVMGYPEETDRHRRDVLDRSSAGQSLYGIRSEEPGIVAIPRAVVSYGKKANLAYKGVGTYVRFMATVSPEGKIRRPEFL